MNEFERNERQNNKGSLVKKNIRHQNKPTHLVFYFLDISVLKHSLLSEHIRCVYQTAYLYDSYLCKNS